MVDLEPLPVFLSSLTAHSSESVFSKSLSSVMVSAPSGILLSSERKPSPCSMSVSTSSMSLWHIFTCVRRIDLDGSFSLQFFSGHKKTVCMSGFFTTLTDPPANLSPDTDGLERSDLVSMWITLLCCTGSMSKLEMINDCSIIIWSSLSICSSV